MDSVQDHASPHVPHLGDLDIVLSSVLAHKKRYRGKQGGVVVPPVQRSFEKAWDDYRSHHIVSQHALQLIRNFVLAQMPTSVEADDEEEGIQKKQTLAKVFTPWASPDSIQAMLARISSQGDQQRTKHEQVLDKACEMTQRLWGFDEDEDMRDASAPCTNGHIASYTRVSRYWKLSSVQDFFLFSVPGDWGATASQIPTRFQRLGEWRREAAPSFPLLFFLPPPRNLFVL